MVSIHTVRAFNMKELTIILSSSYGKLLRIQKTENQIYFFDLFTQKEAK